MTTAYCFDPEHVYHLEGQHPEHPNRLVAVMDRLERSGRLATMDEVPCVSAPMDAITRVHDEQYPFLIESVCVRGGGHLDVDTYVTEASFRVARRGLGGLLALVDRVLDGRADNAFALTRPPGHHARPFNAMGFCLFANAAAAARHARDVHGLERVLIVDFDVHHGNGTQEILYDDPDVLVFSSHQYPCYPGTGEAHETGASGGAGFNANAPVAPGTGDAEMLDVYRRVLLPLADRFRPELVIVSAGFDGHHMDPLADLELSTTGYAQLMTILLEVADRHCDNRLVATLEGGYHPGALADSIASCLAVMEDPAAPIDDAYGPGRQRGEDVSRLIDDLRGLHGL
jgi:acetoin utilization deacetylase AcuC-like enzyme